MAEINDHPTLKEEALRAEIDTQDKKTPREFLLKYVNYLPLFFLSVAVCLALMFVYIRYKAPLYSSSIKIYIKEDQNNNSDLSTQIVSEITGKGKSNIANEEEIIKSTTLLEKVVKQLGLNVIYSAKGAVHEMEMYEIPRNNFIVFDQVSDSVGVHEVQIQVENRKIYYITAQGRNEIPNNTLIKSKGFNFSVHINNLSTYQPGYTYYGTWYSPHSMAEGLASQLTVVSLNKDASIMVVSYMSGIPSKGRSILNSLADQYSRSSVEEKNRLVDNTIEFIDGRLLLISGELGGVENQLQTFRQQNNVIDIPTQEQSELGRVNDIKNQMDAIEVKMRVADMVSSYINDPARKFNLVPSSLGIEDVTLLELVKSYNEGVLEREELLKTLAPANIAVTTIEAQLEQLQGKIVENVKNIKSAFQSSYNNAKSEYDLIWQTVHSIPAKEKELLEISRQQGIKEKLYLFLLEKREEAAITRASAVANSSPIDPAVTNPKPIGPTNSVLYSLALMVGLGFPVLIIYLRDLFNDKITTRDDILRSTKAPVIGEVNHSRMLERKIIADKTRGTIAEQFRIIRTNLQYFLKGDKRATIMITSTMPNEGKTFVSMNLGAVLSLSGKKVVLLELDLRKPKIASALDVETAGKGLSTYLTGNATVKDILQPIPSMDNFYLIATGPIPPNPAELLLTEKLDELFAELKKSFDYIVIDSPPIGIVSDARVLARYSDVNFYIVRQRYTPKAYLKLVNELYVHKDLANMALIVNDVVLKGAYGYYGYANNYGYGYGYGYGYSYGYGHNYGYNYGYGYKENEKRSLWRRLKKKSD